MSLWIELKTQISKFIIWICQAFKRLFKTVLRDQWKPTVNGMWNEWVPYNLCIFFFCIGRNSFQPILMKYVPLFSGWHLSRKPRFGTITWSVAKENCHLSYFFYRISFSEHGLWFSWYFLISYDKVVGFPGYIMSSCNLSAEFPRGFWTS